MGLKELSFAPIMVEGGCSASLTIFDLPAGARLTWLEVPDEIADSFIVTDVRVGRDSQLSSTAAVPASLFARSSPLDELLLDAVGETDRSVEVSVTNLTKTPQPFVCYPIFSDEDSRLARYRRARIVGLGVSEVAPLVLSPGEIYAVEGTLSVTVQPQREFVPDRLFVPREVLERVTVDRLEICSWVDGQGRGELLESSPASLLTSGNLEGDGLFHLRSVQSVGPGACIVVSCTNKTRESVDFTGAILGGDPLPLPGSET